jgi:hypothetical protein
VTFRKDEFGALEAAMVWSTIARFAYAQSEAAPTIDPGPILLLGAVVAIAYFVISCKEILAFIALVLVVLMILGVFYLRDMLAGASGVPPPV